MWSVGNLIAPPPQIIADRFRLAANLVLIENVRVNGVTGCMILDTGTSTLLLNSPRLESPATRSAAYHGALGGAGGTTRAVGASGSANSSGRISASAGSKPSGWI